MRVLPSGVSRTFGIGQPTALAVTAGDASVVDGPEVFHYPPDDSFGRNLIGAVAANLAGHVHVDVGIRRRAVAGRTVAIGTVAAEPPVRVADAIRRTDRVVGVRVIVAELPNGGVDGVTVVSVGSVRTEPRAT
ncbi:hypothetical protein [Natrinema caseinilyticum]|uniref:hypothetical protein n=1 Tax=Natrinema caseinilyticum TaxID=2961570 RepID=UPI0020C5236C|nr:hypothetical protein [Natrinema caseinilyticum]